MTGLVRDILKKTYELSIDGPPALDWNAYRRQILEDWIKLLDDCETREESDFQKFLEQHPCMVPGSQGMVGISGHAPYLGALFSQPRLPDFTCKIPDFMWIAKDSQSIYPILIEIEAPKKKWFNRDGTTTANFNQAMGQLIEWKQWFSKPINEIAFANYYKQDTTFRQIRPHFVLIYGRRSEANQNDVLAGKRQHLQSQDISTMTFDRLSPFAVADQFISVRAKSDGHKALYVPATLQIGPMNAEDLTSINNLEDAISGSPFISEARKSFLMRRVPYWRDWARSKDRSVRVPSDRE